MYGAGEPEQINLSAKEKEELPRFDIDVFKRAAKHVHNAGAFTPGMLREGPVAELATATHRCLKKCVDMSLTAGSVPAEMARKLNEDVFVFSGCKTYHELKEASQLLRDASGHIKPFHQFYQDVKAIHPTYNERYLEAEQQFAINAAQSAAQWGQIEAEGDRYNLTYRTAGDGQVRPAHAALDGITLPPTHPFWMQYMTPNGWKCRCRVVQSRAGKYSRTDDATALKLGEQATTEMDSKGRNRAEMFRFNPGKQQVIFPPNHPYYNLSGGVKEIIAEQLAAKDDRQLQLSNIIDGNTVGDAQLSKVMHAYAEKFPEDYNGGLESVVVARSRTAFMSNGRHFKGGNQLTLHNAEFTLPGPDGQGVKFNPAKEVRGAFLAMRDSKSLTFNQEYAMESLWHETLHAKARGWGDRSLRTERTVRSMETVNQFCARHSYPQLIERMGGKASNQKEVLEQGYGYGSYVDNFRAMLKHHGIDEAQTQKDLMPKLLSEPYETVGDMTAEYLKGKGVRNAEKLMDALSQTPRQYEKLFN